MKQRCHWDGRVDLKHKICPHVEMPAFLRQNLEVGPHFTVFSVTSLSRPRQKVVVGATWCLGVTGRNIEQQGKGNLGVSKGRGRMLGTGCHMKMKVPENCEKVRSRGQIPTSNCRAV